MAGVGFRLAWRRVALATAGALILAASVASSAQGAVWLSPFDLSPSISAPRVALDSAGNAIVVWVHSDGINETVQASVRPAGGSFGPPVDLSVPGPNASTPDVALNDAGDAAVVWTRSNGTNQIVQASVRPAEGSFGAPVDVSAAGQNAFSPHAAVDQAGNAVVVWHRLNGTKYIVQASVHQARGTFGVPVDLSAAGQDASASQVAVDPAGDAIAVWQRSNGTNQIVQAALRPKDGSFPNPPAPVDLSDAGGDAVTPQVAFDQAGGAVVVWQRFNGSNQIVQAALRPKNGSFSKAVDLSAVGKNAIEPQVAVGAAGDAVAVWRGSKGAGYNVQASIRPAGGPFDVRVDLSLAGAEQPKVALDEAGDAVAVWRRFDSTSRSQIVQAAVSPAGGTFGAVADLSAAGLDASAPQVAVANADDALAVWVRANVVQAAEYGTPPPPPPSSGPPPASPPSASGASLVLIAGKSVLMSNRGFVPVVLTCSGTTPCAGTLTLKTAKRVRVGRKRARIVQLGTTRFTVPATHRKTIKVHLSKANVALVRRLKRLRATVTVKDAADRRKARASTRTIVLTAK